jgi:hypothetical protein
MEGHAMDEARTQRVLNLLSLALVAVLAGSFAYVILNAL